VALREDFFARRRSTQLALETTQRQPDAQLSMLRWLVVVLLVLLTPETEVALAATRQNTSL
jgi:hypothetical protein